MHLHREIQWHINKNQAITHSRKHVPFKPEDAKIRPIRAKDMILVSETIYYSHEIQGYIYQNPRITHSYKQVPF